MGLLLLKWLGEKIYNQLIQRVNPIKLRLISVRLSLAQGYDNHPLKKVWGVNTQIFLPKFFLPPWRNGRALDFESKGREIDPRREPGFW